MGIRSSYHLRPHDTTMTTRLLLKKNFLYKPDEVLLFVCGYITIHIQQTGKPISSKPFQHPGIITTLRAAFGRPVTMHHWGSRFASSLPDDPERKDEKEIPAPMLALVAAAVSGNILVVSV